ncbi:MAG: hypothetical protein ACRBN8_44895 [Nannocystales bacterium]
MNRTRCGSVCLSALVFAAPAPAYARSSNDGVVAVETNFRGVDEERAKRIEPALQRRAGESLKLSGFDVVPDSDVTIVFHVRSVAEDPSPATVVSDYGTHIEVLVDGERVGEQIVTFCDQKGEAELVDCALGGLEEALPLIPREETPTPGSTTAFETPQVDEDNDSSARKPGAAFILGGGAAVVAGVGGLVTGAVLHVYEDTGDRKDADLGEGQFDEQQSRKLTIPLMVGGAVVVAGGVALIIIGAQKNKKQRKTALLPSLSPEFSGLTLRGKF